MRNLAFILFSLLFFSFEKIPTETIKLTADEKSSSIVYFMSHPLHDWDASAKIFKTVISYDKSTKSILSVASLAKVQSFDSGNSNRDSHAIEVLEALKYPNVTFVSSDIKQNGDVLTINGKLTFHGITKALTINALRKETASLMSITGKMNISMSDFEVRPPSLMGFTTKDNIRLDFTMTFRL